ncbi:alginate O-acetyltransferase [Clostridium nigeriense]|uniref:alginate O-acetyltransferase n=1 Tax=Clostridium nigeriense TaxID=1805470 RepID=UPI003D33B3E4
MKKINIIKITIFISIIMIPIFTFNLKKNQISEIDNRMLTDIEDIFNGQSVKVNIESYINDRIGLRTSLVNIYTKSMDVLFDEMVHPNYQYGKDGYVFSKVSENEFNPEFQEVYADFIEKFEDYCISRGIGFLYAVEPSKEVVYTEYLPEGFNYSNENLDYFLKLLSEKNVNFTNNVDNLLKYKNEILLYDKEYDARHWNETGAIVGISNILEDLNFIDNRIGNFDINNYEVVESVNGKLPNSNFDINEKTIKYNLINDNSKMVNDFNAELRLDENYHNFSYYKNDDNRNGPKILIFAGSYFNDKEKFLTNKFSELIKIHNYRNVIDYEYYINIFNPDIVLFESTEYTHMNYYFPLNGMKNKIYKKNIMEYKDLTNDDFVKVENTYFDKSKTSITNFSIPIESQELLYAYANINNRILDCNINKLDNQSYIEFSIMTSDLENVNGFDLYFISSDEKRYDNVSIYLN